MLRDGHVDGPVTEVMEVPVSTCEPEAVMASSSSAAAAKAWPRDLAIPHSCLLHTYTGAEVQRAGASPI